MAFNIFTTKRDSFRLFLQFYPLLIPTFYHRTPDPLIGLKIWCRHAWGVLVLPTAAQIPAANNVYLRRTRPGRRDTEIQDEAWIKTLEDGRKVKVIYLEQPDDGAFITAQLAGNEVVYPVVLTKAICSVLDIL
jgi:hypothetical protein